MTTEDNNTKFLELEGSASRLLDELEQLRQETRRYDEASTRLESVEDNVNGLTTSLTNIAEQLRNLISGLQEIGLPALLDKISNLESELSDAKKEIQLVNENSSASITAVEDMRANIEDQITEIRASSIRRLDALIEFHSKGFLGKLFGKPAQPK